MTTADPRYDPRDLLRVPSLLSMSRVVFAAAFPWAVGDAPAALAVLALGGLSDVLDGWWARRFHETTPIGAVVDGITDKVFVFVVVATLLVTRRLSGYEVAMLAVRDACELLLAAWLLFHRDARAYHEEQRSDAWGKATTVAQFVAVVLAITRVAPAWPACALSTALGVVAVAHYARRAV